MSARAALAAGTVLSLAAVAAWSWTADLTIGPTAPLHLTRNLPGDYLQLAARADRERLGAVRRRHGDLRAVPAGLRVAAATAARGRRRLMARYRLRRLRRRDRRLVGSAVAAGAGPGRHRRAPARAVRQPCAAGAGRRWPPPGQRDPGLLRGSRPCGSRPAARLPPRSRPPRSPPPNPAGSSTPPSADGNGTVDRGYFQINSSHGSLSTYGAYANARAAVLISSDGTDWTPWTTYQTGAYAGKC